MAEWRNGGMVERWNGGMVEWWNGRMAEWHNVQYEIVRNQDMESTQMTPWQSPSWLVGMKDSLYGEQNVEHSRQGNKNLKSADLLPLSFQ